MTVARQVAQRRDWYHTLELAPGVETPGWFDLRGIAEEMPIPSSLAGKRCLDVGAFDGFWSFEMERRGAAEVVALDILDPREWDWPVGSDAKVIRAISERKGTGEGFEIARQALHSNGERIELSVYDLDPDDVGRFDFIYVGSLLLHLRDPIKALERVGAVASAQVVICDAIDLWRSLFSPRTPVAVLEGRGRPWWWKPNLAGLVRMVEAGGLRVTGRPHRIFMPPGRGHPRRWVRPRMLLTPPGRAKLFSSWFGDPHAVLTGWPKV